MDTQTKDIISVRLEKAKDDIKWARSNLEQGGYRQSINRAYYAVFAIATAALLTLNVTRKKHSGVESAFHQFLVKPGLIEPEYATIYRASFKEREDADYADTTNFTQAQAHQVLADAEKFVERVEKYLRQVGALEHK
ncbi:MAG: HEPN domain-containing protein [Chloroflexi bacterium]|nr:HEPN domain-containing protein [Chloroflexota bacterium]